MKKTIFTLSAIVALAFTGCTIDEAPPILQDPTNPDTAENNIVSVSGMISESTTWTNNNIYVLNQKGHTSHKHIRDICRITNPFMICRIHFSIFVALLSR